MCSHVGGEASRNYFRLGRERNNTSLSETNVHAQCSLKWQR